MVAWLQKTTRFVWDRFLCSVASTDCQLRSGNVEISKKCFAATGLRIMQHFSDKFEVILASLQCCSIQEHKLQH